MTLLWRILFVLTLMLATALPTAAADDIVDITDHFTQHWGDGEQVTHHADGSITFVGRTWGGLAYYLGDADWSAYSRLVFELKQPAPCAIQPIILYKNADGEGNYTAAGVTEAYIDLNPEKRSAVTHAALQTASNGTLEVRRIYLVKEDKGEEVDDTPEADEEQDARLMINELMQSNVDCVMDDLNDFPDSWVELYNGGTTAARLNRYSLGLTPDAGSAWPLPNRKVQSQGRILVCCDKVADSLHTDFRLESGKDCAVYLFRDGQLIDQVTGLKKQPAPNIAYGRETDGGTLWGYQLTATPRQPNSGHVCDHDHLLGQPLFSQPGRVVSGSPAISLTLTVPDGSPPGTVVRYTTDGSEPTAQSPLYAAPLAISATTVVRAKLFCDGWLSPPSTTQSYILFPRQLTLPVISIATNDRYLNDARIGIFTNNTGDKRHNWRRPVNIEFFFGEDQESSINQLCETRIAGAASRGAQKKSMAIYAHKRFGEKRFSHEFFPDQRPGLTDYKSLVLRNAGNDFDYLYMRDAIVQRTMATHVDLDWQAWQPAIVYINGQYHGLLNIRERGNEDNVYTNYNQLEDIDLIENWSDLKEGTWDNYDQFKAFYKEQGHTMAEYEEWMDCQEFINLMIMNLYFNNFDFPGNNIVMWRPRAEGGRWRWIAKDCDYVMGLYGQGQPDYNTLEWLYNPNYDSQHNWGANGSSATRLFRRLMDDADFRREFIDRCAVYMGTFLNEQGIRAVWDPMYQLISYEYPNHRKLINQWWPNYASELSSARQWVSQRTSQLYRLLANYYQLGTPIPMTISWDNAADADDQPSITFNGIPLNSPHQPTQQPTPTPPEGRGLDTLSADVCQQGNHLPSLGEGSGVGHLDTLSADVPLQGNHLPSLREGSGVGSLPSLGEGSGVGFYGAFFQGRTFTLEATPRLGREVTAWQVTQVAAGGATTTSTVSGPLLSMQMPHCQQLVVTPVIAEASSIATLSHQRSWTSQAAEPSATFNVYHSTFTIRLSGVSAGTTVALYDLRGILISHTTADGTDIRLDLPSSGAARGAFYLLKVGDKVVKL